jgi:hypothetical protein
MTLALNPAGLPELDIPGMIAMLKAQGYRVSKPRQTRAYSEVGVDVRQCVHCYNAAARIVLVGGKRKADKREVGICDTCYRFGPRMTTIPIRATDPARHDRLMRVWRRAHNRYAARLRQHGQHAWQSKQADAFAGRILAAITNEPTDRDYTPESKLPRVRRQDS